MGAGYKFKEFEGFGSAGRLPHGGQKWKPEDVPMLFKSPKKSILQRKANLQELPGEGVPEEYRVHAFGGEVPRELATDRFAWEDPLSISPSRAWRRLRGTQGSPESAAEWVRKEVLPRLPAKYRKGSYGMDVMRIKNPDGGYSYKLVEMNARDKGGISGLLDPIENPDMMNRMHRYIHGTDLPSIARVKARRAALLGGAAGGGVGLVTGLRNDKG
jgi:hypothetical protein